MDYYVYVYLDPLKPCDLEYNGYVFKFEPFYVGKGKNDRFKHHLNHVLRGGVLDNNLKYNRIKGILDKGREPIIYKIEKKLEEKFALDLEESLIREIGRINIKTGSLTNLLDSSWKSQNNYKHSDETKKKISKSLKNKKIINNTYSLISPDNVRYSNINLKDFCIDNSLNYDKIRKSCNKGKIKIKFKTRSTLKTLNCEGWELFDDTKEISFKTKKYVLLSPNNKTYYKEEISNFCEYKKMSVRTLIRNMNKGKIKILHKNTANQETLNCEGWSIYNTINRNVKCLSNSKEKYILIDPNGEIEYCKNLTKYCEENNLSLRTLRTFMNNGTVNKIHKSPNKKFLNTFGWACYQL